MTRAILFGLCVAFAAVPSLAEDTAIVAGVEVRIGADGRPLPLDAARRAQLVENLRASFAALGVNAHSGPEQVHADGHSSMKVGLDKSLITVARQRADGTLEMSCVQGAEKAAGILAGDYGDNQ